MDGARGEKVGAIIEGVQARESEWTGGEVVELLLVSCPEEFFEEDVKTSVVSLTQRPEEGGQESSLEGFFGEDPKSSVSSLKGFFEEGPRTSV